MRRALVTGTSSGIGRAVARMLLAEGGWEVIAITRSEPPLTRDDPETWRARHFRWPWDIEDWPYPENWDRIDAYLSAPLDALIHCAAVRGEYSPLLDGDPERWIDTVNTNLLGTYRVVYTALPALLRAPDARVLLMSGGGAFDPAPGYSAYAVSKAGVVALAETLAAELAETSVTVNAVAPGFVATGIHAGTPDEGRDDGGALNRVLACVNYLLSPAARGLTGKTISAQWDDWPNLTPWIVDQVNDSTMGTRWRRPVQNLQQLLVRTIKAM